ncbi:MAG: aminotransferase class V-fold PLP-dependent enzyme, partial [Chlorobiota bacterium]
MKSLFFLRDDVTFLNHGSFGASPLPVMREYQRIQIELEKQPVEFMDRRHDGMLSDARNCLAGYLGCGSEDIVYVPNTTTGVNAVARSLPLKPGDEVLISDQEYGALEKMWNFVCLTTGAKLVKAVIPFPLSSSEETKNAILNAVTPKTKVVFFSHISSATALVFPVKDILDALRGTGVYTFIDGAHAPAQIPLNISELDPDFYTGNCHKWMMAPKGTAFLYARKELQNLLVPP